MTDLYNKYIFDLPVMPGVVSQIISVDSDSEYSAGDFSEIIKLDPYLTSRVLKIANSSTYSRQREITSIIDAVTLIGQKKIKTICLLIIGSELVENKKDPFYFNFWNEAIHTAFIAEAIAIETGKSVIKDDIFTAGILHNIGQAILFNLSNDKYNSVLNKSYSTKIRLSDVEIESFGIDNHTVAAGVLDKWDFPQLIIDTVKYHLNRNAHSNFQNIIDIISIAKLIYNRKSSECEISDANELLLSYQSRINLRTSQINYYLEEFVDKIKEKSFYQLCMETVNA